jgi:hypothetical protein
MEIGLDEDFGEVLLPFLKFFTFMNDEITVLEVFNKADAVSCLVLRVFLLYVFHSYELCRHSPSDFPVLF